MWQSDVFTTLQAHYDQTQIDCISPYFIVDVLGTKVHLVSLENDFEPFMLLSLQQKYTDQNILLVHLWEDVWYTRREQVLSRINSFAHKNQTIYGRKTKILTIDGPAANAFLDENHLQGGSRCQLYLGVFTQESLVAVAGFGKVRLMSRKNPPERSMELIRFATKSGYTIVGGLGKLLQYVADLVEVDDIMTYADRDWSIGIGYAKLGFQQPSETSPIQMFVDRKTFRRSLIGTSSGTNPNAAVEAQPFEVFNTGNLKYHYKTRS